MAATKLTAPGGGTVSVDSSKVDGLLRRGFTKQEPKKAASKKSSSKSE